ncbi:hypothetical protein [Micromonospora sp. NPDC023956]|uniref:hypothetical protein n=1 Tax=Micromonospora sp. NPDC023956 TaxID=3155722 RepID=UPI0033DB5814
MAGVRIRLDRKGMAAMLKSAPVAAVMAELGADVSTAVEAHQSIRRHKMPVIHGAHVTDRAAHTVTVAHAGGLAVEAKYGALIDAARTVGLDVNPREEAE